MVTNGADAGGGSLRQAILDANNESTHPGPDTIVFTTIGGTVNLSTIAGTQFGPNALEVTSTITILGNGVTIRRDPPTERGAVVNYRLFFVSDVGDLTIRDMTLTNGLAKGGNGGDHNGKIGGSGGGGLGAGGAIYNRGTLTIDRSTFTANTARGGNGGRGFQNIGTSMGSTGGGGMGGNGGGTPSSGVNGSGGGGGFLGNGAAGTGDVGGGGGGVNSATGQNGGSFTGGRGGDAGASGSAGGLGGGGGGGSSSTTSTNFGGNGGVGGGGGGGRFFGGHGGFGGGGGGGTANSINGSGTGGFGGGGGTQALGGFGGGRGAFSTFNGGGGGGGAGLGGAIFNDSGTISITNSTFSGNSAIGGTGGAALNPLDNGFAGTGLGGGLLTRNGSVTVRNSTFTNNTAQAGRGIMVVADGSDATIHLNNSILGQSGTPTITDLEGEIINKGSISSSAFGNLIRKTDDEISLTGGIVSQADPLLLPLANNGGLTFTHLPLDNSPVIDAGNLDEASGLATDQRRAYGRVFNGKVDIGAVEVQTELNSRLVLVGGTLSGSGRLFSPLNGQLVPGTTIPFFPGSTVNVRTVMADVTGDGVADFIGGTGPGTATKVVIINGSSGKTIATISPFEAAFTGGVFVAAGDIDGDGKQDLVVTPDQGGGPIAALYSGAKLASGLTNNDAQFRRFFGIEDPFFRGGARPAFGDLDGDGLADLIVSAGFQGGPRIAMFDGASLPDSKITPSHMVGDFFAFEPGLRNGAFVAAGDMNGDGRAEVFFGAGPDGAPRVRMFDGAKLLTAGSFNNLDAIVGKAQLANFFAGDSSLRGGVRMTIADPDNNGIPDLITGSGDGEPSRVRVFKSLNLFVNPIPTADQTLDPFGETLADGVYVG